MESIFGKTMYPSLAQWCDIIEEKQANIPVESVALKEGAQVVARDGKHLGKVHTLYLQRFDDLLGAAKEEKEQERERGGAK